MFRWLQQLITDTNLMLMSENLQKISVISGQRSGLQSYCLFHQEQEESGVQSTVIDMHFELRDVKAGDIMRIQRRLYRVAAVIARDDCLKLDVVTQETLERSI